MKSRWMWSYAFFIPFRSEGPMLKLAWEPVQGYGRGYEVLVVFVVDRFDGFYNLFLRAKFSR